MDAASLISALIAIEPRAQPREKCDRAAVSVPIEALPAFMRRVRDDAPLAFDLLYTHTAVDWPAENRLELVYLLYSQRHGHQALISVSVPRETPEAPSMSALWRIAEWHEREVYDMFGVRYTQHPDLRRILLPDDWRGFPLRKDYQDDFMLTPA